MKNPVSQEIVVQRIVIIRGRKVILDKDLAYLYQVKPIALRQQVRRNKERFPADFIIRLTKKEVEFLVSQNVIPSIKNLGGYLPCAFTEQGIAMLSSVLRSKRAVLVNISIMRAFVKLRRIISTHKKLANKLNELEKHIQKHDTEIQAIFEAIRQLMEPPPEAPKRRMGFHTD